MISFLGRYILTDRVGRPQDTDRLQATWSAELAGGAIHWHQHGMDVPTLTA